MIKNVYRSSWKVPVILVWYEWPSNVLDRFSKSTQISYSLPTGILRLPWLRFFRAFSSVIRQMPGYNLQRPDTARTLPNFCVVLCIVCFVSFPVLFVCKCVLYYCHRVTTQLQLNISYIYYTIYHTKSYITSYHIPYHIIPYHISYHIIYHIISYHILSYHTISYHTIPYHIIYHTISYHIIYHSMP
jgi:hypothetical protein